MIKRSHPYIPNSLPDVKKEMMKEIHIESIDELYADIPQKYLLKEPLNLPQKALSEFEVKSHVESLLSKNRTAIDMPVFLGAGCWPHYIPALVKEVAQRTEFLTSYTSYQPETSQGMLQALFEYQSMIAELADMEVANCSMYDWASALGEAARMASRKTHRREILIPKTIHPERESVLRVYAEPAGIVVKSIAYDRETGLIDIDDLRHKISNGTCAIYVENPSYLGHIESQVDDISKETHAHNALLIVGVDPTSLGILRPPGSYDADIVVGEAQPLGNPMNYGGPLLGIMACRDDLSLVRQMPGRIIGLTTTQEGSRQAFCMTLQTREQHIRREKATSNICSNEALCAVSSAVYMSLLGPEGFRELGETIMRKANYAMKVISDIPGVKAPVFKSAHFKEFTVNFDNVGVTVKQINDKLLEEHVHGGKDISKEFQELGETALYCVTETHSETEVNRLAEALERVLEKR